MLPAARGVPPSSNTEQELVQGGSVALFLAVGSSNSPPKELHFLQPSADARQFLIRMKDVVQQIHPTSAS